jgi:hypothetical protein
LRFDEMQQEMNLRYLILRQLEELMSLENVDEDILKAWMKTLSSVASDYLSLGVESKMLMTSLTTEIFSLSLKLGLSVEDLSDSGMDKVVDLCVSGLLSSSSSESSEYEQLLFLLLEKYSLFVTSDMSTDQYPVSSITPFIRSSSFSLASSSSSSSLSIPSTELETLMHLTPSQQSVALSSGIRFPFQFSISQTTQTHFLNESKSLVNSSNSNTSHHFQLSLPLFVSFTSSPCHSNGDRTTCGMRMFLQNKLKSPSLSSQNFLSDSTPAAEYFEVDCVSGVVEDHHYTCPSGDMITISCNGSFSARGRHTCPKLSNSIECKTIVTSSTLNSAISRNISCSILEHNDSVITCDCNLSDVGEIETGSSVSFSIISIEKSLLQEFVSTWKTVPSLSTQDVLESWVVLVTIGSVGGIFLLMMLVTIQLDAHQKRTSCRSTPEVIPFHQKVEILDSQGKSGEVSAISKPTHWREHLQFLEESLPSVFKSDSLWNKFKEEVKVYHRWFGIVFYYSPEFPRSMRVLSLFSSIVIMLFVQSVTYNIADPDDGSCEKCESEGCCLSLKSTLDSQEERCDWYQFSDQNRSHQGTEDSCHFRDIGQDMTRTLMVALISAIVSAPIALTVQYLIANVLSKEVIDQKEEEKKKERFEKQRIQRLMSMRKQMKINSDMRCVQLVEQCGKSLQEDLNNLLKELSGYYSFLREKPQNLQQAEEFRSQYSLPPSPPRSSLSLIPPMTLCSCRYLGICCSDGRFYEHHHRHHCV